MKSEPDVYGIDHLRAEKRKTDHWDGIRNYQARNFMRDEMKKGDLAFFYHSNCEEPAIVGVIEIVREGYPDHTAFLANEKYFDAKSDPKEPTCLPKRSKHVAQITKIVSATSFEKMLTIYTKIRLK